ncbi:MAG: hypothetical protein DMG83_07485 [Acidobacteria bacterium]|nr:MAG: hypothetical protein DMG83_07485 [Acidobacteriota bacterium]
MVNDSLGHSAGDELLIEIARRLTASFRYTDTVARPGATDDSEWRSSTGSIARLGGDEFTVLLEDVFKPSDAVRVAQRIQEKLAIPFDLNAHQVVITASIGAAFCRQGPLRGFRCHYACDGRASTAVGNRSSSRYRTGRVDRLLPAYRRAA